MASYSETSRLLDYTIDSGTIQIIDSDNSCTIILNRFIGTIDRIDDACTYFTILTLHDSHISSSVSLFSRSDKLDTIFIKGKGTLYVQELKSTSVEIQADIVASHIEGNVVKLSKCKVEGDQEEIVPPQPVNKSELQDLVDRFVQGQGDYDISQYYISENGLDVETIYQWITQEAKDRFDNAFESANAVLQSEIVTQETVDDALDELLDAFQSLNPQWGKKLITDKSRLEEAIIRARMQLAAYSTSVDGYNIPSDVEWISIQESEYLENVKQHAESIYDDTTVDQVTVDNEVQILSYAIDNLSPEWGKKVNPDPADEDLRQRLLSKLNQLTVILDMFHPSIDGTDVPTDERWVTVFTHTNLRTTVNFGFTIYRDLTSSAIRVENILRSLDIACESMNPLPGSYESPDDEIFIPTDIPRGLNRSLRSTNLRNVNETPRYDEFISAKGHIWIVDAILIIDNGYDYGIKSPYILFDNSQCDAVGAIKVFDTENAISIENCINIGYIETAFTCYSFVNDDLGKPKDFLYVVTRDNDGQISGIHSRRKLYGYATSVYDNDQKLYQDVNIPAQLASSYDLFKHSTQYTNVDLHRWMDQNGELYKGRGRNYIPDEVINLICRSLWSGESIEWEAIPDEVIDAICAATYDFPYHPHTSEPISREVVQEILSGSYRWPRENSYEFDEVRSRNYELGIYSLNSYRTTELVFYKDNDPVCEDRELP